MCHKYMIRSFLQLADQEHSVQPPRFLPPLREFMSCHSSRKHARGILDVLAHHLCEPGPLPRSHRPLLLLRYSQRVEDEHALIPDVVLHRLRVLASGEHRDEAAPHCHQPLLAVRSHQPREVAQERQRDNKEKRCALCLAITHPLLERHPSQRREHRAHQPHRRRVVRHVRGHSLASGERDTHGPGEANRPHGLHRLFYRVDVHVDEIQRRAQPPRAQEIRGLQHPLRGVA
mmetsp:Transcript_14086/g.23110  ORF Transcript_14086/g.23110 Transcript_14086/m.23110 type:complete len:231 (+) Transcript_14086:1674-2366(+)